MKRPLLLGMVRSDGQDGPALLPSESGSTNSSADRLLAISAMDRAEFLARFRRKNLLERGAWAKHEAELAGSVLRSKLRGKVLVLGKATWAALGLPKRGHFCRFTHGATEFVLLPHPSGRNLECNSQGTKTKMRKVLNE